MKSKRITVLWPFHSSGVAVNGIWLFQALKKDFKGRRYL
jgi:hypothetical protein